MSHVPPGGVARVRIAVRDLDRACRFYVDLFGWSVVRVGPDERELRSPCGLAALLSPAGDPSTAGPELYVRVVSIEAALRRAGTLGGARLARASPPVRGVRTAVVMDTEGNRVGLWEAT
jgi:predicted enzyme related to lactoylglutathione lyase